MKVDLRQQLATSFELTMRRTKCSGDDCCGVAIADGAWRQSQENQDIVRVELLFRLVFMAFAAGKETHRA